MGTTRLAIYLVGLVVVVGAVWVFFTQTSIGKSVPAGIALALILLLVGIGVMLSARNINESRSTRRVSQGYSGAPGSYADTRYAVPPPPAYSSVVPPPPAAGESETIVDERRYD